MQNNFLFPTFNPLMDSDASYSHIFSLAPSDLNE